MTTRVERTRAKHNALTAEYGRLKTREEKLKAALRRLWDKEEETRRAIVRSQKRLDKLLIVTHNAGPTASPLPEVINKVESKPAEVIDDGIPDEFRRGPKPAAPAAPVADVTEVSWSEMVGDDLRSEAASKLRAEIATTKKQKRAGQDARRKAARSGETKRMPLSGKDAARFIADGR